MRVRLVSHASVIVGTSDTEIWSDPWLAGTAFNDSWRLMPEAAPPKTDTLARLPYIWISHEHPDHFHVATLRALPDTIKRGVTVLFQKTNSTKMEDALRKFGFERIRLLEHRRVTPITPKTSVYCYQVGQMDSILAVLHGEEKLINVNDAEIRRGDCNIITRDLGKGFNVALNQFSIAGYSGLADRDRHLTAQAARILDNMVENHRDLAAEATIPFASLVYFCCRDNRYMNAYANRPGDVFERFQGEGLRCVPLWPGEEFVTGEETDPLPTLARYELLYDRVDDLPYDEPPPFDLEALRRAFVQRCDQLREKYPSALLRLCGPMKVYVPDLDVTVELAFSDGRFDVTNGNRDPDLEVFAQPLHFAFAMPWGVQTLGVSARLIVRKNYRRWRRYRILTSMNNAEVWLRPKYLLTRSNLHYLRSRWRGGLRQIYAKYQRGKQ